MRTKDHGQRSGERPNVEPRERRSISSRTPVRRNCVGGPSDHERDDRQYDEDDYQYAGDFHRHTCDAARAEDAGQDRENEKGDGEFEDRHRHHHPDELVGRLSCATVVRTIVEGMARSEPHRQCTLLSLH